MATKPVKWNFAQELTNPEWTEFWNNALFVAPIWEGTGQQLQDLATSNLSVNYFGNSPGFTWVSDNYGVALSGTGEDPAWAITGILNGTILNQYNFNTNQSFVLVATAPNQTGLYDFELAGLGNNNGNTWGLALGNGSNPFYTGYTGTNLAFEDASVRYDTGFAWPAGESHIVSGSINASAQTVDIYVDGAFKKTIQCTNLQFPQSAPYIDYSNFYPAAAGQIIDAFYIINGTTTAEWHQSIAVNPFAPYTQIDTGVVTSDTYDFNLDIIGIIDEAQARVGGSQATGYDQRKAVTTLNLLLTDWVNRGVNLWTIEALQMTLNQGQSTYLLPLNTSDIFQAVISPTTGNDIPIERISHEQYLNINDKNNQALPIKYYTNRQSSYVSVTVWPVPDAAGLYVLKYLQLRYMQDAGVQTNNMDVPRRFLPALVSGLAYMLALKSTDLWLKDAQVRQGILGSLKAQYDEDWANAIGEDRERSKFRMIPRFRHGWRR